MRGCKCGGRDRSARRRGCRRCGQDRSGRMRGFRRRGRERSGRMCWRWCGCGDWSRGRCGCRSRDWSRGMCRRCCSRRPVCSLVQAVARLRRGRAFVAAGRKPHDKREHQCKSDCRPTEHRGLLTFDTPKTTGTMQRKNTVNGEIRQPSDTGNKNIVPPKLNAGRRGQPLHCHRRLRSWLTSTEPTRCN